MTRFCESVVPRLRARLAISPPHEHDSPVTVAAFSPDGASGELGGAGQISAQIDHRRLHVCVAEPQRDLPQIAGRLEDSQRARMPKHGPDTARSAIGRQTVAIPVGCEIALRLQARGGPYAVARIRVPSPNDNCS
jgi:hypothetical protein